LHSFKGLVQPIEVLSVDLSDDPDRLGFETL
jgi:hypothetical protein